MNELFSQYCGSERTDADGRTYLIQTQHVWVEKGIRHRLAESASPHLGDSERPVLIVVDDNTLLAAGEEVRGSFQAGRRDLQVLHLKDPPGKDHLICDDATVDQVTEVLRDSGAGAGLAVGSGTITDLVKMSCHRLHIPSVSVPTAPSNNGYTSAIAAILSEGIKTTQPCTPVRAVFADPEVLAAAPYPMIASGIGDLYSRPVSNADWRLGYRLTGSYYSTAVMDIVDAGAALLEGVFEDLAERDEGAVERLTGAIMLSGLAMQAAGTSGPASGGEHLISHYLDMTAERDGEPHDLHGCQVAVATIITAELYERLQRLDPTSIDVEARVQAIESWASYRDTLGQRFGELAPAVTKQAETIYPRADALRERLNLLVSEWAELVPWICETLHPAAKLRRELSRASCPVTFAEIGVSQPRAVRATQHCKDIRNRYTILHLLWELGVLADWSAEIVNQQWG